MTAGGGRLQAGAMALLLLLGAAATPALAQDGAVPAPAEPQADEQPTAPAPQPASAPEAPSGAPRRSTMPLVAVGLLVAGFAGFLVHRSYATPSSDGLAALAVPLADGELEGDYELAKDAH